MPLGPVRSSRIGDRCVRALILFIWSLSARAFQGQNLHQPDYLFKVCMRRAIQFA